jgi:hypothetical protein
MSATSRSIGPGICWRTNPPLWNDQPSPGCPSSLRLLNKFKTAYPLQKFVTHEFPIHEVDKAMAQAFDIDLCMKVVLTRSSG